MSSIVNQTVIVVLCLFAAVLRANEILFSGPSFDFHDSTLKRIFN